MFHYSWIKAFSTCVSIPIYVTTDDNFKQRKKSLNIYVSAKIFTQPFSITRPVITLKVNKVYKPPPNICVASAPFFNISTNTIVKHKTFAVKKKRLLILSTYVRNKRNWIEFIIIFYTPAKVQRMDFFYTQLNVWEMSHVKLQVWVAVPSCCYCVSGLFSTQITIISHQTTKTRLLLMLHHTTPPL